jgi:dTMP kinase
MAIERFPAIMVEIPIPRVHFSLEGIDGVGKTTQVIRLEKELLSRNIPVQVGKSPSSTPLGEFLRHNMGSLKTWERNALFLMDMIAVLKDNEGTNRVLIWDRYKDSNRIANKDMTLEEAEGSVACLPETTRTFLLDLDPEIIVKTRQDSLHSHSMDLDWQREKRRRYLDLAERHSPRIIVIDATLEEELITEFIAQSIVSDLKERGLI